MQDLIILGVTVHASEMAEIVQRINAVRPTWNLLGFIVAERQAKRVPGSHSGYPVLGTRSALADSAAACVVPAFGYNDPLEVPPERVVSLIDPSAFVSKTARLGRGCVIYPSCFIGLNATVGDRAFVLSGCAINHDDHLEDNVTLASGVTLAGHVHVEADCYLGQGCTVRQDVRIGKGSLIGMGCVVLNTVPPNSVMVGNPARRLRARHAQT